MCATCGTCARLATTARAPSSGSAALSRRRRVSAPSLGHEDGLRQIPTKDWQRSQMKLANVWPILQPDTVRLHTISEDEASAHRRQLRVDLRLCRLQVVEIQSISGTPPN